jgi:hypothetical protein
MTFFYSTVYLVGDPLDNDFFRNEMNPKFIMLRGENERVTMNVFYIDKGLEQMSKIRTVVFDSPDDPNMLLDSAIAFYPEFFKNCSTFSKLKDQLKDASPLDLNLNMPEGWRELREEALPYFRKLRINSAIFEENWRIDP